MCPSVPLQSILPFLFHHYGLEARAGSPAATKEQEKIASRDGGGRRSFCSHHMHMHMHMHMHIRQAGSLFMFTGELALRVLLACFDCCLFFPT